MQSDNSVGKLFPIDVNLYRSYIAQFRDEQYKILNYKNASIDNLNFIKSIYLRQQAYNTYVLPYFLKNRRLLGEISYEVDNLNNKKYFSNTKFIRYIN